MQCFRHRPQGASPAASLSVSALQPQGVDAHVVA